LGNTSEYSIYQFLSQQKNRLPSVFCRKA